MKSMMIPALWDTASSPPRTRFSDAAKSSFQREQTSADCQAPAALPRSHPLPPAGKAPSFEESAQGKPKKTPLSRGGWDVTRECAWVCRRGPSLSSPSALTVCGWGLLDQTLLASGETSLSPVRAMVGGDADAFLVGKRLKGTVTRARACPSRAPFPLLFFFILFNTSA